MKAKTTTREPLPLGDATPTTVYYTIKFVAGTLKGLTANESQTTYDRARLVAWINRHRTEPVKPIPGYGSSAYIITDASFQTYQRQGV